MTTMNTPEDVVKAAASIARDAAEGRLDPADLERQAVAELTALVGTVAGPDGPLWVLQVAIARQVLAAGAIDHQELAEWAAVGRRCEQPDGDAAGTEPAVLADVPPNADSDALEPYSAESGADGGDPDVEPLAELPAETAGCGCGTVSPPVVTADGRRVPSRQILARGRGLPDTGFLG